MRIFFFKSNGHLFKENTKKCSVKTISVTHPFHETVRLNSGVHTESVPQPIARGRLTTDL